MTKSVVFSLDVKEFFPHVGPDRVHRIFGGLGFRDQAAQILTSATTYNYQLPQGAATSTSLANLSLIRADHRILKLAEVHGFAYTRFVDDLTVSGEWRLLKFRRLIPRILETEGFQVRPEKTVTMDRGMRQTVTKLVVNGKINVSAEYRRSVRREILDCVGGIDTDSLPSLRGRIYWLRHVNPAVGKRLLERLDQIGRSGPPAHSHLGV
jgi:retron-type reverse transcriptase